MTTHDAIRIIRFRPYAKPYSDERPIFKLTTWDANRTAFGGKNVVGYRLSIGCGGYNVVGNPAAWNVIFEGEDFGCSPLHAIDSDETCAAIMSFLCLRPGDTDPEYFDGYTDEQLEFAAQHAESLSCAVIDRFGER